MYLGARFERWFIALNCYSGCVSSSCDGVTRGGE